MPRLFKKLFIPHELNDNHPHSLRHHSLLSYALILIIANFLVFPALGLTPTKVSASGISEAEIIDLANKDRKLNSLNILTENPELAAAARAKAQDMFKKQYWSHYGPNNETPWQFMKEAGYDYTYAGENLAKNFTTSIDAHSAWMASPTHRSNILNSKFKDIGIGFEKGLFQNEETIIIVQMFGTRETSSEAIINSSAISSKAIPPKTTLEVTSQTKVEPSPVLSQNIKGKSDTLKAPVITSPLNNTESKTKNILLKGIAESGSFLKIFSNNKIISELPNEGAAFTTNITLSNGNNEVYIKATDQINSKESLDSNKVNIVVNFIPEVKAATSIENVPRNGIAQMLSNKTQTFSQKFNVIFIGFICLLVTLDTLFVLKKGIKRDTSSYHSFNMVIIFVVMLGIFIL